MSERMHVRKVATAVAAVVVLAAVVVRTAEWSGQDRTDPLVSFEEFQKLNAKGAVLVMDVRDPESFKNGRIPGSINVPLGKAKARAEEIRRAAKGRPIVTYCACPSEATSTRAAQGLREMGFEDVKALVGGYVQWVKVVGTVEK